MNKKTKHLLAAFDTLPASLAITMDLHHGCARTVDDVANMLRTTRTTIKAQLAEAADHLSAAVGAMNAGQGAIRDACAHRVRIRSAAHRSAVCYQQVAGVLRDLTSTESPAIDRAVTAKALATMLGENHVRVMGAINKMRAAKILAPERTLRVLDRSELVMAAIIVPTVEGVVVATWLEPGGIIIHNREAPILLPALSTELTVEQVDAILSSHASLAAAEVVDGANPDTDLRHYYTDRVAEAAEQDVGRTLSGPELARLLELFVERLEAQLQERLGGAAVQL